MGRNVLPKSKNCDSAMQLCWPRCEKRSQPMLAATAVCLVMLLSACAAQPIVHTVPVTKTVRQWVPIPAERVSPLEIPQPPPVLLWGQSLELNAALYGVIEQCQIDRTKIRQLNERLGE
jgi:hypothetical protein